MSPTTRRRRAREMMMHDGLTAAKHEFFSLGLSLDGNDYEATTSQDERRDDWRKHRGAIMTRFMAELRERGVSWAGVRPPAF